jgi:predicted Zn-dependent peptidase
MDLRETKGWSYGVRGGIDRNEESVAYLLRAPVQADKTGDSIKALRDQISAFLTTKGVTAAELERTVNGSIRELPGSYETSSAVLGQMQADAIYGRPFDYVEGLSAKYKAETTTTLDAAARRMIDPSRLVWVVVGDKDKVLPQLQGLGLPVIVAGEQVPAAPRPKGE